jgi:hypothetical protein
LLSRNKGKVISKQEIMEKVWELSFDTGTNTIEVYISFLRNKIDKPFESKLIHNQAWLWLLCKGNAAVMRVRIRFVITLTLVVSATPGYLFPDYLYIILQEQRN